MLTHLQGAFFCYHFKPVRKSLLCSFGTTWKSFLQLYRRLNLKIKCFGRGSRVHMSQTQNILRQNKAFFTKMSRRFYSYLKVMLLNMYVCLCVYVGRAVNDGKEQRERRREEGRENVEKVVEREEKMGRRRIF